MSERLLGHETLALGMLRGAGVLGPGLFVAALQSRHFSLDQVDPVRVVLLARRRPLHFV